MFLNFDSFQTGNEIESLGKSFPAGKDFCLNSGDEKTKS